MNPKLKQVLEAPLYLFWILLLPLYIIAAIEMALSLPKGNNKYYMN